MTTDSEMELSEWMERLPENHMANREYAAMKDKIERLRTPRLCPCCGGLIDLNRCIDVHGKRNRKTSVIAPGDGDEC